MQDTLLRLFWLAALSVACGWNPVEAAQARTATLRIVVVDPTGAVIVGAAVSVAPVDGSAVAATGMTDDRGEASFPALPHGRYSVAAAFAGFENGRIPELRLRADVRREMKLAIARHAEEVTVDRDPRERASDPRGNAFGNLLTREQIDALPDDPDEMERALEEMGGPGTVIRVDGFRGGKLPPKSQIRGIRFRRDLFAAENHGGGMVFVDIMTNPGGGPFRGSADFTFRDESLNARNPMAPRQGPEQQRNGAFTAAGTLWKNRTGFSFSSTGATGYDSRTIFAAVPGERLADVVRRPAERAGFTARVDHALTAAHTLRAGYARNTADSENLGVGDYDLPERGYARRTEDDTWRLSFNGPIGRRFFAESRFQVRSSRSEAESLFAGPALLVLDAFNAGGAQLSGGRAATEYELAADVDYAAGHHSARAGLLLEAGRYRGDEMRNAAGTFVFSSLQAFDERRPTTFTQRSGDPLVRFSHAQLGWYAQDDVRINKALSLSLGVRHELQTHIDDHLNLAPRLGATWSPFRNGKTVFRGGVGVFYEWYDSQVHEQTLRVDGERQTEIAVRNPGFPDPYADDGSLSILPSGRIVRAADLKMPAIVRGNVAVERTLGAATRLMAGYSFGRGRNLLRARNTNAPDGDGQLPDPLAGIVTQVESTGRSATHMLHTSLSLNVPWHRTNLFVNYTLAQARNDTDGPFSLPADSRDLDAEWGPSANDMRHRASALFNMDLWKGLKLSTAINASSRAPYNITTGFDDNGDTVSNDRPAGVGRNAARGAARSEAGARLSWSFGFGTRQSGEGPAGPQVVIRTLGGPAAEMGGFSGGADDKRWRFELYLAGTNLLNRTNPLAFSGVMTSPFFGRHTSALPGRRIELGTRFSF